jgi:hypothetical protein
MLPRMILYTLLATLVIGALALGYQASSRTDGISDAVGALAHLVSDDDHDRDHD